MTPGARLATAADILDLVLEGEPAGLTLTNWGRKNRFAGSRDRAAIRDIVFDCLRQKQSLAHAAGSETGRGLVLAYVAASGTPLDTIFDGAGYNPAPLNAVEQARFAGNAAPEPAPDPAPDPVRLNYPAFLDAELRRSLGADFEAVLSAMTTRAPVDLRVNQRKARLPVAVAALKGDDIDVVPVADVPTALRVTKNQRRIGNSVAYREGLVELQDASSQAVALFAGAAKGMRVLDYCAGGGGKALALHDAMGGTGTVVAHDIAQIRMNDLPKRAARAGARITVAMPGHPALMPESFDLVFVDAPCTGTGSWRRTPDAKWRMTQKDLDKALAAQATILRRAADFVAPGGVLTYATCSMLASENQDQITAFLAETPEFRHDGAIFLTPLTTGDGFFAARLLRV